MKRKEITINGDNFNDADGFRNEINRVLTIGEGSTWMTWYNLDAFNDFLHGGFGVHEYGEPIKLIWENANKSKNVLGHKAATSYYENILKRCHPKNRTKLNELLENAKQEKGDTLFDIIIHIIKEHEDIELLLR
ncbi:hypothetical protein DP73_18055 [Desulfosporosinus sp. HMP52]|uniref:barstar family protein n=1 Tax=Desulfosporosinus sp. HMP52 TaxID=1487923 RepID=UPI00051FCE98|nr:barstar family protein [Desulfosporosinus sp. HMP52]KGK85834.1 hypothetical protein DP73_18055 [Desulfosporosinus sp. HMP52]